MGTLVSSKTESCGCKEKLMQSLITAARADGVDISKMSDGYHSFEELYHHRAILTAALFSSYPNLAWKSVKNSEGEEDPGWFLVGIKTPRGQATYHYSIKYWDYFKVQTLEKAPEWDGHTSAEAVERIASMIFE